jgi:hypothetical protein
MKKMVKVWGCILMMLVSAKVWSQKIDDARMVRDIEVGENVLSTLLRQKFDKQRMFFPIEVKANYQPGYGITFRLPADFTTPIAFNFDGMDGDNFVWHNPQGPQIYTYSYNSEDNEEMDENEEPEIEIEEPVEPEEPEEPQEPQEPQEHPDKAEAKHIHKEIIKEQKRNAKEQKQIVKEQKEFQLQHQHMNHNQNIRVKVDPRVVVIDNNGQRNIIKRGGANLDSVRDINNAKVIEAAKEFLADYGDLLSQLQPEEKIIITNQGEQPRMWVGKLMNSPNRTHLSVEATKGDISQFKQGKLSKDQFLAKVKVVNTETVEAVEPDLELLSSIFDRLYQPDLARTFFTEDHIYYERLKDYGVIYYMQVYSSNQNNFTFTMPTQNLDNVDQKTRDAKVKEMYPAFEKEIKENILEYGRTVKSLKDNEVLTFNIKLTRCKDCGIPSSLEVSVKGSVLKDYSAGKIDKSAAQNKMEVKKGPVQ